MTDWLAFSRGCVEELERVLAELPTRAEREPVLRAGEGGDDTTAIDAAAEDVVVRRLEALGIDLTLVSEELGIRTFGAGGELRVVVDPIDGSVNAKRGIPYFSLSLAVADGPAMDDVTFGFVHDFGAGEEWVAERGHGARLGGEPLDGPGPKETVEILALEGTTTEAIADVVSGLRGVAQRVRRDGLAGAVALPSRCRTGRRGLLPEAGALDRHRSRPAPRPRARPGRSSSSRTLRSVMPCSTSASARGSSRPPERRAMRRPRGSALRCVGVLRLKCRAPYREWLGWTAWPPTAMRSSWRSSA